MSSERPLNAALFAHYMSGQPERVLTIQLGQLPNGQQITAITHPSGQVEMHAHFRTEKTIEAVSKAIHEHHERIIENAHTDEHNATRGTNG